MLKLSKPTRIMKRIARERSKYGIESYEDAMQTSREKLIKFNNNEKILNTWHSREMYKYMHPEINRRDRRCKGTYGVRYTDAMAIGNRVCYVNDSIMDYLIDNNKIGLNNE